MTYEEAVARVGDDQPTWVLRDILDRLEATSVKAEAIRVILGRR